MPLLGYADGLALEGADRPGAGLEGSGHASWWKKADGSRLVPPQQRRGDLG